MNKNNPPGGDNRPKANPPEAPTALSQASHAPLQAAAPSRIQASLGEGEGEQGGKKTKPQST